MTWPVEGSAQLPPLRCDHCGRVVHETRHTPSSYAVDYYALHTGDVESSTMRTDDDRQAITFQKLLRAVVLITCADCYRDPAIRLEREQRFRPERMGDRGEAHE